MTGRRAFLLLALLAVAAQSVLLLPTLDEGAALRGGDLTVLGSVLGHDPWMTDDAFIHLRYARNLVDGHGLVFNPGERVEGYTSLSWVLLLAMAGALGADFVVAAQLLAPLFALATLVLLYRAHRFVPELGPDGAALAALLLGTCGVFAPWAQSGMESSLFAFGLTAFLLAAARWRGASGGRAAVAIGLLGGAVVLTRPDGALPVGLVGLAVLVRCARGGGWAPFAHLALAAAALPLLQLAFRLGYYGELLPNTFHAKVGATAAQLPRGLAYTGEFAVCTAPLLAAAAAAGFARRPLAALGGTIVLAWAAYVTAVGGDHMPAFRFYSGVVPLLCLAAVLGVGALRRPVLRAAAAALCSVWGVVAMEAHPLLDGYVRWDKLWLLGEATGEWLAEQAAGDPSASVATNAAGAIPYFSRLPTIDMLGLTDRHIARRPVEDFGTGQAGHERGDGRYVLDRDPRFVLFGSVIGSAAAQYRSDFELIVMPEFHARYRLEKVTLRPRGQIDPFEIAVYVRRD